MGQLIFIPYSSDSGGGVTYPLDIYVSAVNGNDARDGSTPALAVETLERAWELVPNSIGGNVRIHLGSGDYEWVAPKVPQILTSGARVYLVGDGAGQAGDDGFTSIVSGVAGVGTTTTSLVLQAAALANEYWGLTLISNNTYMSVQRNDATTAFLNDAVVGL